MEGRGVRFMSSITQVSIAVPNFEVDQGAMHDVALRWIPDDLKLQEKFTRICSRSGVERRRFILPYAETLSLNGMAGRAALFEEHGTGLLTTAIEQALADSRYDPAEIDSIVFTSCSVPMIPSIDAKAIFQTSLRRDISRVPMYQQGCAGGVVALSLGSKLARQGKPVLVASTELCSLVFQPENQSGSHLVGAAIFADGAAATVISPDRGGMDHSGVNVIGTQSVLLPESRHLMGYDIFDDGFHLRLDRGLPNALVRAVPELVTSFLSSHGRYREEIGAWLFHPGGIKILDFLGETFSLEKEQCHWSYDVLREHGNMSSATILFVLQRFLSERRLEEGELALVLGIGPGLTVEMILLEG
jgi:alkylresorcinol/alkylpyrone synthase